ncbi:MAG: hypothetical protein ORN51_12040 [Akkermansiaceae bacterium]|nr:hypothetical protein [Akkermansiaceae bacterium]
MTQPSEVAEMDGLVREQGAAHAKHACQFSKTELADFLESQAVREDTKTGGRVSPVCGAIRTASWKDQS